MEKLNEYLQQLLSTCSYELRLEPNKMPYLVNSSGSSEIAKTPILGTQISMLVFPLIPPEAKQELPNKPEIQFVHNNGTGNFNFLVKKTPAGFDVTVRPDFSGDGGTAPTSPAANAAPAYKSAPPMVEFSSPPPPPIASVPAIPAPEFKLPDNSFLNSAKSFDAKAAPPAETPKPPTLQTEYEVRDVPHVEANVYNEVPAAKLETPLQKQAESLAESYAPPPKTSTFTAVKTNSRAQEKMENLFRKMAEVGASDLHLSTSMPPMIRKDGKMKQLEGEDKTLSAEAMKELLTSIMPAKNQEEFIRRNDTDFAYQIEGLARFRANIFMDRKGMGGVFRIIPAKITTAEQLGLSKAIMGLCNLSKGLVVVTGPTGSGKSTTLCAMVNSINYTREDHIITIEDPIEFTHENQKCLVNQREVHNHTDSFKDALRAALREDPDILLVGEMRDLETIAIAIETAETGHLVFGTLHTTTAASTVDRIIDQFPADRQQQIRVMLSESLKGVISQTLLPKKGGGRVAALEVLIVTPAISNLIREGKTFQIPSAMQTGKQHGMVMLNDALMELVQKGIVEPKDAYLKAVEKTGFEALLTRNGFKL